MQQSRTHWPRPASLTIALRLAIIAVLILPGCSGWATYPPIEGAAQLGHPKLEPVPSITAEAIRYAHERYVRTDEIVFNLPEGSPPDFYESVKLRLGGKGRPMIVPGEPAVHIDAVRVRAMDAQVDVTYPRPDGHYEMVTLYMRQKFLHKYEVRDTRLWRIHVEPPSPRYKPPPAPDAELDTGADSSEQVAPNAEPKA